MRGRKESHHETEYRGKAQQEEKGGEKHDETNTFLHVMSFSVSNDHPLLHLLVLHELHLLVSFTRRDDCCDLSRKGERRKGVTSPSHVTTLANGVASCNEKRREV